MELIERYLQATRFWLPKHAKQDILAELTEDIHAQVEEREIALGRKLTNAEVAAMLKERGRPILVANAYLPQRYLIGPVLFPIYTFVIKIICACYVVPWVLVYVGLLFSSAYRTSHLGSYWPAGLGTAWGTLWTAAFTALGVATVVFAILERVPEKSNLFERWDPMKLPTLRDPNLISRTSSSFELAINLVLLAIWAPMMASLLVVNQTGTQVLLTPLWHVFFSGFLVLWLATTAMAAASLLQPHWTVGRATLGLAIDVTGAALFCWMMEANLLSEIHLANVSPERAQQMVGAFNSWMTQCFPIAVITGVVIAVVDVARIVRVKGRGDGSGAKTVMTMGTRT